MENNLPDKVVSDLQKDFRVVGASRVHGWYAYAMIGIAFGLALGAIYVTNRSGQFLASQAQVVASDAPSLDSTNPKSAAEFSGAKNPSDLVGAPTKDDATAAFNLLLARYQERHASPDSIIVMPGKIVTLAGANNAGVQLDAAAKQIYAFRSAAQKQNVQQALSNFTSPVEIFFSASEMKSRSGHLIFPGKTAQGTGFATIFADPTSKNFIAGGGGACAQQIGQVTTVPGGACTIVTVTKPTCYLVGEFKGTYKGKTESTTYLNYKLGKCETDLDCKKVAEDGVKTGLQWIFIGKNPSQSDRFKYYAPPSQGGVTVKTISNTSSCTNENAEYP